MVEANNIQIPWTAISKKMGKRSRLSCFKKWQKLTGLAPEPTPKSKTPAAAAAAATTAAAAADSHPEIDYTNATEEDQDVILVTEILNQGKDPPDWTIGAFAAMDNPALRWNTLVGQWQLEECPEPEEFEAMNLFDAAHAVLEWKREQGEAKMAAATVEAVDLPSMSETRQV